MADPINNALEAAYKKVSDLLAERSRIDKELVGWKRVIDSLMAVSEGEDASDPSDVQVSALGKPSGKTTIKFTDGVRMVLQQNQHREVPISVPEIKAQLINLGFDFSKYAQPLVPVHNCLKRLEEQREVSALKNEQGQTLGYKWVSEVERAFRLPFGHGEATGGWISGQVNRLEELAAKEQKATGVLRTVNRWRRKK
jgi:hypothetical protein